MSYGNKGETLRDHELAVARGPIMLGTPAKPNDPKVGRVLGGGRVKKEYPYTLVIKENRESYHTAKMLETVVNSRFHQTEDGHQKGVATGKTASYLVLQGARRCTTRTRSASSASSSLLPMVDGPELRAAAAGRLEQGPARPQDGGRGGPEARGPRPHRDRRPQGGPQEHQ